MTEHVHVEEQKRQRERKSYPSEKSKQVFPSFLQTDVHTHGLIMIKVAIMML